jgi:hypothetical protein
MRVRDVAIRRESRSESIVRLVAGLAVVVLTVLGLAEVGPPTFLVAIATIVFGAGLWLKTVFATYSAPEGRLGSYSSESPTVLLAGVAGIVLGILALVGAPAIQLAVLAVIAFGRALLIGSYAGVRMRILAATSTNADPAFARIVRDMATGPAGLPTMAGSAAIVLGIFALCGLAPTELMLIALLELGCFSSLTSGLIGVSFARAF